MGVVGVFTGLLAADVFVALACLRAVTLALGESNCQPPTGFAPLPTQALLRFGLSAMIFSVLNMALCSLDIILVRHLAGEAQAGCTRRPCSGRNLCGSFPSPLKG